MAGSLPILKSNYYHSSWTKNCYMAPEVLGRVAPALQLHTKNVHIIFLPALISHRIALAPICH